VHQPRSFPARRRRAPAYYRRCPGFRAAAQTSACSGAGAARAATFRQYCSAVWRGGVFRRARAARRSTETVPAQALGEAGQAVFQGAGKPLLGKALGQACGRLLGGFARLQGLERGLHGADGAAAQRGGLRDHLEGGRLFGLAREVPGDIVQNVARRDRAPIAKRPPADDLGSLSAFRRDDKTPRAMPASRCVGAERGHQPAAARHGVNVLGDGRALRGVGRERVAVGEPHASALVAQPRPRHKAFPARRRAQHQPVVANARNLEHGAVPPDIAVRPPRGEGGIRAPELNRAGNPGGSNS